MDSAILRAVTFIHHHKNIRIGVGNLFLGSGFKLVDDGGNQVGFIFADQFDQVFAVFGAADGFAAIVEGIPDLFVEIDAVGDEDDARVLNVRVQGEGFRQHDHRERFAAACGVPDDAARTHAAVEMGNAGDGLFDGEVLLVAGDLLDARVVDNELIDQFEQALGAQEAVERAILRGGESFARAFQIFKVTHDRGCIFSMDEQGSFGRIRQRRVNEAVYFILNIRFFAPYRPIFFGGGSRGVHGFVLADAEQELRILEEVRDFVILLVADVLGDRFKNGLFACSCSFIRSLAFDNDERDAVDKDDDIGAAGFITTALLHNEFIADVIDVVFGMLPVYVIEVETARIARDGLRQADAEGEQFVDFLVGADKTVIGFLPELTDGILKIGFAERNFVPLKADAVMLTQPVEQNILQNDVAELAAAFGKGVIGREVLIAQPHEQLQGRDL